MPPPLTSRSTTGHDAAFGAGYTTRGNVTATRRQLGTQWLETGYEFDILGNVVKSTDPRNFATTLQYGCSYGLVSQVTNPLNHVTTIQNDCSLGRPTLVTDPNNVQISYVYNDPLDRLTQGTDIL